MKCKCQGVRSHFTSGTMRRIYGTLFELNQELIREYNKRTNNTVSLMEHVKQVLQMVDKAAALRCNFQRIFCS